MNEHEKMEQELRAKLERFDRKFKAWRDFILFNVMIFLLLGACIKGSTSMLPTYGLVLLMFFWVCSEILARGTQAFEVIFGKENSNKEQ